MFYAILFCIVAGYQTFIKFCYCLCYIFRIYFTYCNPKLIILY